MAVAFWLLCWEKKTGKLKEKKVEKDFKNVNVCFSSKTKYILFWLRNYKKVSFFLLLGTKKLHYKTHKYNEQRQSFLLYFLYLWAGIFILRNFNEFFFYIYINFCYIFSVYFVYFIIIHLVFSLWILHECVWMGFNCVLVCIGLVWFCCHITFIYNQKQSNYPSHSFALFSVFVVVVVAVADIGLFSAFYFNIIIILFLFCR